MDKHLDLIISRFGYVGIFLALALGVVGLPIPDELLLSFIGNKIAQGKLNLLLSLGTAFLGAISGISLSYFIGKKLGLPVLLKYGQKIHITKDRIEKTQDKINKYGSALLVIGFFIPGLRHVAAISAGTSDMSYSRFAVFSYFGALLWVTFFVLIGRELGEEWHIIRRYFLLYRAYLPQLTVVLIVAFLIYYLYIRKPR